MNIFLNFSKKYKFSTHLSVKNENIEMVKEVKLLGIYITEDLEWNKTKSEVYLNNLQQHSQQQKEFGKSAGICS